MLRHRAFGCNSQDSIPNGTIASGMVRLVQPQTYICARSMRRPLFAKTFLSDDQAGKSGQQLIPATPGLSKLFWKPASQNRRPMTGTENQLSNTVGTMLRLRAALDVVSTLAANSSTVPCAEGRYCEQDTAPWASRRRYDCKRLQLAAARRIAKLCQVGLAKRLGWQQAYVARYETGERTLAVHEYVAARLP